MSKSLKPNPSTGTIRVIGGTLRGSKIEVVNAPGLRPSSDRMRETLFNWLMHKVPGACCLDLFAGTGALGIEALSRGARFVSFVEPNSLVANKLQANLLRLNQSTFELQTTSAEQFLRLSKNNFDLVFLDPPFEAQMWDAICYALEHSQLLALDAWIYLESPHNQPIKLPENWSLWRETRMGDVRAAIYRRVLPSAALDG